MAEFTSPHPNLHVHGVARFREGRFSTADPKVTAALRASKYASEVQDGFDPAGHTVPEVAEHLAGADPDERVRVLSAEEDGKARKTIAGMAG